MNNLSASLFILSEARLDLSDSLFSIIVIHLVKHCILVIGEFLVGGWTLAELELPVNLFVTHLIWIITLILVIESIHRV